ncbi:EAL domain-containing protein [Dasania sp. GY-MA-18]|uniref:cyclic-guanylate-specific phosphodiesterase n=1 Tax=Dasania phycosphaerae TaxID=2950436 RepID=A0A9J6RMQ4_9GAMM|nr:MULTISPECIES: EAL domain-containing protein [Dasania]MCR8923169.1 EAL domain-containing protein [Dasania sp. GY-MA-18]MCZ0865601.1 EAL domain-containing protein [Dasania phycosphaerae]MCZ0869326.1 EAL domain-containing protein [Dasania phycosphaerae]
MAQPRKNFSNYIVDICTSQRIAMRLSQGQLAHMCGLELKQVQDFEQGLDNLSLAQLEILLNTLNIQCLLNEYSQGPDEDLRRQRESLQKKALRQLAKSDAIINGYIEQAVQLICKTTSQVLHAEFTGAWLLNEDKNYLNCIDEYVLSQDLHEPEYEYSAEEFPAWFAEFEGRRSLVHDTVTESNYATQQEFDEERKQWNIKSSIESTVIENGEIIGVITSEDIVERSWTVDEISFHNQVADLIMLTVRNSNYRKMQESFDQKNQLMQRHHNAVFTLMHDESIAEGVIQEGCDQITKVVGEQVAPEAYSVCIWLLASDDHSMKCVSAYLATQKTHDKNSARYDYTLQSYPNYIKALEKNRLICSANVYESEAYSDFADTLLMADGIVSSASVGVYVYGKLVGGVCIDYCELHQWSSEEEGLLSDISNQVSLLVLNHERKKSSHQLHMLSRAVENSSSAVFIAQQDRRINYCNNQFLKLLNKDASQILGLKVNELPFSDSSVDDAVAMLNAIAKNEAWRGELEFKREHDHALWILFSITPVVNNERGVIEYVGVCEDISNIKLAHQEMEQLAFYDPLTGLVNRRLFKERLKQHISFAKRHGTQAAILYLDLDRFKVVNDTLGHDVGDQLLVAIADRLKTSMREQDTVARLGGDEFTVLVPDIKNISDVEALARKIIAVIQKPIAVAGKKLSTTTSIGVSLYPDHEKDSIELMKMADMAMYHAKSEGRNNYQIYNERINMFSADYLDMENDLRQALVNKEFVLYYQPIIDAKTHRIHKLEALIRWQHPTKGLLSPVVFIPVAEELGLIEGIGAWVLEQACTDLVQMHKTHPEVQMAVNLTAGEFSNPELVKKVKSVLDKTGLPGRFLTLEITESMLISQLEKAINTLKGLKKMGIVIAIDDFGTGYSSLSYLKRLPLDFLKVDRSFVKDIPEDNNDMEITAAVISMAQKLHLQVVAEGVETEEQLRFLEGNSCNYYQGYLFSKPKPYAELETVFTEMLTKLDQEVL